MKTIIGNNSRRQHLLPGCSPALRLISPAWLVAACGAAALAFLAAGTARAQGDFQGATHMMPFDEDTIQYSKEPGKNAVTELQRKIDAGEVTLQFRPEQGYLLSLLEHLDAPVSSQMLVFSKTSLQRERIGPSNPRAVYFGDDAYVGWIPGAPLLEIAVSDPTLGGVFYTLEQTKVDKPRLVRNDQCLECHASSKTMGVPGHLIRSFATDESGIVDLSTGTSLVNHRTPLRERWGGWYVTGKHGSQLHRGNLIGKAAFARQTEEPNYQGNLEDLKRFFETERYPRGQSDIVALMVFEHQAHMHNFLTRLQYETTLALAQYGHLNYLKSITEAFLKYLLFTDEAPLSARIEGDKAFACAFEGQGPKDTQGRSLRQFDLERRLFKYPCSYMIYSEAFDQLPEKMRELLYRRLWEILNGKDASAHFQRIPAPTRHAILEILLDTKPGLPAYWHEGASQ